MVDLAIGAPKIAVYPNPAIDRITLDVSVTAFRALNALGQDVTSSIERSGDRSLDVSRLPAGAYQIVLSGSVASFVKQ